MFFRMIKMDCRRCFHPIKFMLIVLFLVMFICICGMETMIHVLKYPDSYDVVWVFDHDILSFDQYKIVMAFILGALYTSSVCKDDESNYLRMILSRVDVTTYIISRLLINTIAVVSACILAFFMFAILSYPILNIYNGQPLGSPYYYTPIIEISPLIYIGMMAIQFGMLVSVGSGIGFLFSAYLNNTFVSVGMVGMTLFIGLSYIPYESVFSMLSLSCMKGSPGLENFSVLINYAWGIVYPICIIILCGYLFNRRMKWRMLNGYI